jgi:hypothetical protein
LGTIGDRHGHIEQYDVWSLLLDERERLLRIGGKPDTEVSDSFEGKRNKPTNVLVIVDHENGCRSHFIDQYDLKTAG